MAGQFKMQPSRFGGVVSKDGSSGFKTEKGRYHLYVSYACPWAHRTLVVRKLKGLEDAISFDVLDYIKGDEGWKFSKDYPDSVNGFNYLREAYFKVDKDYDGRYTVPVLWDKTQQTIVNNESSEIIRILNTEFNDFSSSPEQASLDLYPSQLRAKIDELNEWIYKLVGAELISLKLYPACAMHVRVCCSLQSGTKLECTVIPLYSQSVLVWGKEILTSS